MLPLLAEGSQYTCVPENHNLVFGFPGNHAYRVPTVC